MSQNELSASAAVQLPQEKNTKKPVSFTATTPMQKQLNSAKQISAYMAGKYVNMENVHDLKGNYHPSFSGLLVGVMKLGRKPYYQLLDENRHVYYMEAEKRPVVIKPEDLSPNFSVLDYMRRADWKYLLELCTSSISELGGTIVGNLIINYRMQNAPEPKAADKKASNKKKSKNG